MRLSIALFVATQLLAGPWCCTLTGADRDQVRVGTFDSRAIAIAYAGSKEFNQELRELRKESEEAKTAGRNQRVTELEEQGKALQELLHKQGFSTWPVTDILQRIKSKLPDIARQAEVDVIVSKWDLVYQKRGLELVDVTALLVAEFDPSEKTLKTVREIQAKDPVPLEQLGRD